MEKKERERLIGVYRDGYRAIVEALQGATDDLLDARPRAGAWTAREIVHHLADSEMTAAIRLRLLLVEDRPQIRGYDQDAFVSRLSFDRPHEASLMAFRYARECTAQILERLADEQWRREGTHSEVGAFSVERWLETYATHAHNHARQILETLDAAKRAAQ
jgi:hypothetical protein